MAYSISLLLGTKEALEIKRRARIITLYKICTRTELHVAILRTAYALTATGVNPLAIGFTRALQWEIRFQSCVKSSTNRMLKRQKCKNAGPTLQKIVYEISKSIDFNEIILISSDFTDFKLIS